MTPLVTALIGPISNLISEFITDKDKQNELAHKIATLAEKQAHEVQLAQIDVNKQEAQHASVFVAGWRPFIGWVCGVAMGFNYLAVPLIGIWHDIAALDIATMFPVLMGLLGLGGLRTVEKSKGVARETMTQGND